MSILIVGIILVAGAHFVYEGILLPSFRLYLRYKLYALRDEIRALKIMHGEDLSDDVFKYLHEGINGTLKILPFLDYSLLSRFTYDYQHNDDLKKRIEKRTEMMEKCQIKEVHNIKGRLIGYTWRAVMVNTGGWVIYLLPFAIVFVLVTLLIGLFNRCKQFVRAKITAIVFSPEKTQQYIPVGYAIDGSAELQV